IEEQQEELGRHLANTDTRERDEDRMFRALTKDAKNFDGYNVAVVVSTAISPNLGTEVTKTNMLLASLRAACNLVTGLQSLVATLQKRIIDKDNRITVMQAEIDGLRVQLKKSAVAN